MSRIACLLIPDLPVQAELRVHPELERTPLVITSGPGSRAEVVAVSLEASAQGVHPRQTLAQARAVCPDLVARIASPVLERAAREALLDVALSLAPRAELAERGSGLFVAEGAVHVDATGIRAIHENEGVFASLLHARAGRAGLRGVVALASSRHLARLAARDLAYLPSRSDPRPSSRPGARTDAPTRILPSEDELAFLAPLPIDLLDPDDRTAQALTRFGLRRIRDLLKLSRRDLAARLGPDGLTLIARARGEETEPPLSEPREIRLEEGVDLETPIESLEPLTFVLRGLVSRLTGRLELRSLGCSELRLSLQLVDRRRERRRIGMASPNHDAPIWLRLLRNAIESRPPAAAVEGLVLDCEGVPARREQLDLFLPPGPAPSELDRTLAELGALCGSERVGAPAVADDHRPDGFELRPFQGSRPATGAGRDPRSAEPPMRALMRGPRLSLRVLRPPQPAEVRLEAGSPIFVRSPVGQGTVSVAAGPWRTTGHWWSDSAHFAIDHYDIETSDGTLCRLRFDWRTRQWQIDGVYD
ncbi:MAG: DNA polymerase Y family protein [bacterium]